MIQSCMVPRVNVVTSLPIRPGGLDAPWNTAEFYLIALEHQRQEREAMRAAPIPLVISDADSFATTIWHERYLDSVSPSVELLAQPWRGRTSIF